MATGVNLIAEEAAAAIRGEIDVTDAAGEVFAAGIYLSKDGVTDGVEAGCLGITT